MRFTEAFRSDLADLFAWRRDVRRFHRHPLPPGSLERLVALAGLAPSVGLSEPWRFVRVEDPARRAAVRTSFARCNADALAAQPDERAGLYARLKLAGLDDAPCQFALFADHGTAQGYGLGRATMPEMLDYSAVLALGTLWLAARATGGSSGISVSAFRSPRRLCRSWSGPDGNGAATAGRPSSPDDGAGAHCLSLYQASVFSARQTCDSGLRHLSGE